MNAPINKYNFDLNTVKPDIRQNIPIGVPLFVQLQYTPGGLGPNGCLTASKTPGSDAEYLNCEFTVLRGPYAGRKFYSRLTFFGGEVDEKGASKAQSISLQSARAIVSSAHGLAADDESPNAQQIRAKFGDPSKLQGIKFFTLSAIGKPREGYEQKNELGGHWNILTINNKRFPGRGADGSISDAAVAAALDNPVIPAQPGAKPAPAPLPTSFGAGSGTVDATSSGALQSTTQAVQTAASTPPPGGAPSVIPNWAKGVG